MLNYLTDNLILKITLLFKQNFEQGDAPDLKKEMNKRDVLISRLLATSTYLILLTKLS